MDEDPEDMEGERTNTGVGRNSKGEFVDDEEADLNDQEIDNVRNEALLKRLYNVAQAEIQDFENNKGAYEKQLPDETSHMGNMD